MSVVSLCSPHAVTNAQGQGYLYDNNGNVTQDDMNVYTWNIKNQLTSVTTPSTGASWSYTYDPFGTRLTSTNETTGETTIYVSPTMEVRPDEAIYYVYAGSQRIASISVPHESGTSSDLSTLVLGDPDTDGTLTYYHQDHLGGTQLTTDQYGVVTQVYDYYPYGSELLDENLGAPDVPYSFTGKELNEDTGLYYFEARWYDPTIGRFMSADPMQYVAPEKLLGDPQAFNYYAYSRNNPVNMVDPDGELFETAWVALAKYWRATGNQYSAAFLEHSLVSTPGNLYYGKSSDLAGDVRGSREYQAAQSQIISNVKSGVLEGTIGIEFTNGDLETAIQHADINYSVTQNDDGTYTLNISLSDVYNFEGSDENDAFWTGVAIDMATLDQKLDSINSYSVEVDLVETEVSVTQKDD